MEVDAACIGPSHARIVPEDNVAITLRFKDGSLASILYLSNGARGFNRERCEVHAELRSGVWQDFRHIKLVRDLRLPRIHRSWLFPKKGYKEELDAFFATALQPDSPTIEWLPGQIDASLATISATKRMQSK